mgnify:CR=1 FL=1
MRKEKLKPIGHEDEAPKESSKLSDLPPLKNHQARDVSWDIP